jgi:hypothetical protein
MAIVLDVRVVALQVVVLVTGRQALLEGMSKGL